MLSFRMLKIIEYKENLDDSEWLQRVNIELESRRKNNVKLLHEYKLM